MASDALVHVIDDDEGMRGALGSLLRSAGFGVALHASTDAFRGFVETDTPSCLVLDIRLRGENGLDFQDWLVAEGRDMPVILVTGHGDIPMTVRGMRAGAIDFLPKPPRGRRALMRVCKPKGQIGLANWTPEAFIGQVFQDARQISAAPAGARSPALWGTNARLTEMFDAEARSIKAESRLFKFRYRSPAHFLDVFKTYYGPVLKAFAAPRAGETGRAA